MSAANPADLPNEAEGINEADFLANAVRQATALDEQVHLMKRALQERLYALRIVNDPELRASADAIKEQIESGKIHEGEVTRAEFAAIRESWA